MMLANFNKDNLYVSVLTNRSNALEWKKVIAIKYAIIHVTISAVLLTLSVIARNTNKFLAMLLLTFFCVLLDWSILQTLLKLTKTEEVDDILYGKAYASIYVNEERLLGLVGSMDRALGLYQIIPYYFTIVTIAQIVFLSLILIL